MNLRKQVIVAAGLFLFMEEEDKERPFEERGKTNQALVELLTARGLGGEPSDILRALETEVMYANLLDHIRGACRKSSAEPMIRHLKEKYGITNTPPIWTMMEVVEFGTVTLYYQGLPTDVQRLVADAFHVPPNALGGILNLLRRARNVCAHHSRFWNRRINAGVSSGLGNATEIAPLEECLRASSEQKGTSAFVTLSLVAYCMSVFRPESEWKNRCRGFLAVLDAFVLRGMGFPADWQSLALWK